MPVKQANVRPGGRFLFVFLVIFALFFKAETHDATNRGDTSRQQVASSALLLRQVACA